MVDGSLKQGRPNTHQWRTPVMSLLLALVLHAGFLMLPLVSPDVEPARDGVLIEMQLTQSFPTPVEALEQAPPEPKPDPIPEPPPEPLEQLASQPEPLPESLPKPPIEPVSEPEPEPQFTQEPPQILTPYARKPLEEMDSAEKQQLASSLLSRQYISQEPVIEQLFGKPAVTTEGPVADFQHPLGTSMLTMLNTPMPELPFEYQEGLIHFAYDPGVKGDLQRFWDVITPEIAFRTKYGTEVRCIWILIIGGCAWK